MGTSNTTLLLLNNDILIPALPIHHCSLSCGDTGAYNHSHVQATLLQTTVSKNFAQTSASPSELFLQPASAHPMIARGAWGPMGSSRKCFLRVAMSSFVCCTN